MFSCKQLHYVGVQVCVRARWLNHLQHTPACKAVSSLLFTIHRLAVYWSQLELVFHQVPVSS